MKVSDEIVTRFRQASPYVYRRMLEPGQTREHLQAALDTLPDVQPFAFAGYPDNPVYLHPTCGTVVDVSPISRDMRDAVDAGECDCENTGPWLRIYVERSKP